MVVVDVIFCLFLHFSTSIFPSLCVFFFFISFGLSLDEIYKHTHIYTFRPLWLRNKSMCSPNVACGKKINAIEINGRVKRRQWRECNIIYELVVVVYVFVYGYTMANKSDHALLSNTNTMILLWHMEYII